MQGLNLINSTNLDYFQPQHQAEMINLKAQFFAVLGDSDAGAGWMPCLHATLCPSSQQSPAHCPVQRTACSANR